MNQHLLILGAGVEPIPGIGFPLANRPLVELFQYLADRLGKGVGKAFGTYDSGSNKAGVQGEEPGRNFRKNWRAHLD